MSLSPEDSLRLNVMLAQNVQAVRINVFKNIVYAITQKGEAKVQLHPNAEDGIYQKQVKDVLLNHLVGETKGFEAFGKRWMILGNSENNLSDLLKIAEPDALKKVIHSPLLTEEIAKLAWWCEQSSENARIMLKTKKVAQSQFGKELAEFLIEFLSHEEDQQNIINSLKSVLQKGLISSEQQADLWKKGKRKNIYYVGFLLAMPYNMPSSYNKHPAYEVICIGKDFLSLNPCFIKLQFFLSSEGQNYINTLISVLKKPATPIVVYGVLTAIRNVLIDIAPDKINRQDIKKLFVKFDDFKFDNKYLKESYMELSENLPEKYQKYLQNMFSLSMVSEFIAVPTLSKNRIVGSAMRKKISHFCNPIINMLNKFLIDDAR